MKLRPVTSALYAVLFATAACSGGAELSDKRLPTGSQTIATSSDYSAIYVANTDHGTVARVPLAPGSEPEQVTVGKLPSRIARGGNRLFVTLRGERKVSVLEERGTTIAEIGQIDVGAEPYGVVASDDGTRVYVTIAMEDKVVEIDGGSLAVLREFAVEGQPRWLALHPSGESLFVASAFGDRVPGTESRRGRLTWIDLVGGKSSRVEIPVPSNFNTGAETPFTSRMTGDISISPNGELLLAPALVIDNTTSIPENDDGTGDVVPTPGGYDAGRFNPVVVSVNLEPNGQPIVGSVSLVSVSAFVNVPVVGYPSSVAIDPNSEIAVVTIEGGAAAIALSIETTATEATDLPSFNGAAEPAIAPGRGGFIGFNSRPNVVYGVPAGPRAVVFAEDDKPAVYSFLDRQLSQLDLTVARDRLSPSDESGGGSSVGFAAPAPDVRVGPGGPNQFPDAQFELRGANILTVSDEILSPLEVQGRRLFFATNDSKMSAGGSGVSCATCHFEGRNDGLTWSFTRGARQTPSLAGRVSLQAPVRWTGDRETVADDALRTSQGLMGGQGMVLADAAAIEAFVDSTPDVHAPLLANDPAVLRGKAIFESAEAACASCHNGPRFTNNQASPMLALGLPVAQTRSLVGIAASAPYYHDGRSETLMDVLDENAKLGDPMGRTSHLTLEQKKDLVSYLKSL